MESQLLLPVSVTSRADIIRLQRELSDVELFLQQARVRKSGESLALPKTGTQLEAVAHVNNLNLLQEPDRQKLEAGFAVLLKSAPQVHISFASSPGAKFMERLVTWFRTEVDPNILLEIGLQPSIAAGCTLRTTSKYFDLSLRKHLAGQQPALLEKIRSTSQQ